MNESVLNDRTVPPNSHMEVLRRAFGETPVDAVLQPAPTVLDRSGNDSFVELSEWKPESGSDDLDMPPDADPEYATTVLADRSTLPPVVADLPEPPEIGVAFRRIKKPTPLNWPFTDTRAALQLVLVVVMLVLSTSLDTVVWTRLSKKVGIFVYVLGELVYAPIFAVVLWVAVGLREFRERCGVKPYRSAMLQRSLSWRTGRQLQSDHWARFAVMAALDELAGLLTTFPVVFLPPVLVIALNQLLLPAIMIASRLYLGRRYAITHLLAAATVCVGVLIALLPMFESFRGYALANGIVNSSAGMTALWIGLLLAAKPVSAYAHVYKERYAQELDLDPLLATACIGTLQCAIGFVLVWPTLAIALPAVFGVSPSALGFYLQDGFGCFAGLTPDPFYAVSTLPTLGQLNFTDSVGNLTAHGFAHNATDLFRVAETRCDSVWLLFLAFMAVNPAFNILHFYLIKATTANLAAFTSTLRIGVSAVLFSWPWLAGMAYHPLAASEFLALLTVAIGVAQFWAVPERAIPRAPQYFEVNDDQHFNMD